MAVAAGADDITVVFLDPQSNDAPSPPPRNLIDIAFACYDVMQQKILEDDFNLASLTNVALDNHAAAPRAVQERLAGKRQVALRYVRPGKALPVSVLDFSDQSKLNAAFAQGLADGQHPQAFE